MGIDDIVARARQEATGEHHARVEAVAAVVKDLDPAAIDQVLTKAAAVAKERS